MPANRRKERLDKTLMKEISEVIMTEIKDPRLLSMVTVLEADISKDLKHIKVVVSIYGDDEKNNRKTFAALQNASGFIGSIVGKNRRFRYTPEIRFELTDTLSKTVEFSNRIKELADDDNEVDQN